MKKLLTLLAASLLATACSKQPRIEYNVKPNTFIREAGKYHFKDMELVVRGLEDGTILYGIAGEKSKVLYQHPITKPFSDYQYWMLYVDNAENVWFYNSDLSEFMVHFKQPDGSYATQDGFGNLDKMPKDLKAELEKHNNFKNRPQAPATKQ
ncbi:hypothetical protein AM493_07970 [Flavobacterium akiainvivens]|uniref:Lipoprotein n=1 Tax=Flavobacterium akiainvivens TaxID=1202724 RepID=A0A0M9VHV7_9FLAO|nr:hypothetical protein [Flavobacterium akiainvivens]KOS05979.1 hypothetical protein AM493_07970 [Flavobacterium akiainvivens]SFQ53859.1 hypothetical protein SAMN05444144_10775 [Flavobacterium akiainvivens]